MNIQLLITFIILNILNVIIQTVKSIVTIKCGKGIAAIVNAVAFGLYTIVTVYLMCELDLYLKAGIVALCNLIGVYVVKWCEEKSRKDRLWKVELTVPTKYKDAIDFDLRTVPHSYIELSNKHTLFNFYCATQKDSAKVKAIANQYEAKYFVAESKNL